MKQPVRPSPRAFAQARDGYQPSALIDLGGEWSFRAVGDEAWLPAQVPGTVHSDLQRSGKIPDPYWRDNELLVQWVERKDWEYRREFSVSAALLAHDRVMLECRGLDTIAEVRINGRPVAQTDNMFIEHEFDAKRFLRAGRNTIAIVFRSPLEWSEARKRAEPKAAGFCPPGDDRLDCAKGLSFWLRKEACGFGWDWALRLVTCGIWKPIRLAAYRSGRISDLSVDQRWEASGAVTVEIRGQIQSFGGAPLRGELTLDFGGRRVGRKSFRLARGGKVRAKFRLARPELWWPSGWGAQPLYRVEAVLNDRAGPVHRREMKIGLRRVELLREKDERGEGFAFQINGRRIFAQGANWVPADALSDRLTEERYRGLLDSARAAHFNMLRVWGGGRYEADEFYDYCDQNGIMIWQDFMFAVGPYIANADYLRGVKTEVAGVIRRRRHHPSVVLWCGNNESEANMAGVQEWMKRYPAATWEEYERIFHRLIPGLVRRLDPRRPYWPSSPHHPLDRELLKPGAETASGDTHDWDVWHGEFAFSQFERMGRIRFASEYGFVSLPTEPALRAFAAPDDLRVNSYVLDHHEKTGVMTRRALADRPPNRGIARIARYAAGLLPMPAGLEQWVYISQVMHAEALRLGTLAMRRNFPASAGALVWQFNDNWPAISYSTVDFAGGWKAPQYALRRAFQPVAVSAVVDGPRVVLWGSNGSLAPVEIDCEWELARFDGAVLARGGAAFQLPANGSVPLMPLDFSGQIGEDPELRTYRNDRFGRMAEHYLWFRLVQGKRELAADAVFFAPCKYLKLAAPRLRCRVRRSGGRAVLEVEAERFAAFVELRSEGGGGRFSDNFFHLPPGRVKRVEVLAAGAGGAGAGFSARSLADVG